MAIDEREPESGSESTAEASTALPEFETPEPILDEEPVAVPADVEPGSAAAPEEAAAPEWAPEPVAEHELEHAALAEPDGEGEPEPTSEPPVEPVPEPPPAPEPTTVGAYVAHALRSAGVKVAFTVPGESFLGLLEALEGAGIRTIATRHEGGAAFMAEAYGQLTGRPAACLGTRAVGAANLAIGIHTARQDSTPMFALVGQVDRGVKGREAFQEVDQVDSFGRLAKWAVELDRASAVPAAMDDATRRAISGRPGPVLISCPEDLLDETFTPLAAPIARRQTPPPPDPIEVGRIIRLLTDARRPVILAGAGVLRARATADLVRLAEILEVPIIASWRRPDVFPNDHRLYLGHAGYWAAPSVRQRLREADAILVLGSRLNEPTSDGYAIPGPSAHWAHVDLEPRKAHAGLRAADLALTADARAFLRVARERLAGAVHLASALDARREANERDRATWEVEHDVAAVAPAGPGVHPGRLIATLRELLPKEAILTTDAGNFGGWAARGFTFLRPGTFVGPTSGAMGYGLPAAIAAAYVHRDRPVVALCGDGGLGMSLAEVETAVRERLRPIVVVFDNGRYGTIRAHQERRGRGVGVATELGPIDFAAAAEAMGARGFRVTTDAEVEPALRAALAADRACVIHVALDRAWVSVDEVRTAG